MKTELATIEAMSLDAIALACQSTFEEVEGVFHQIERHRNRLEFLGRLLTVAKSKVPHGEWEDWITDTFQGRLKLRTVRHWMSESKRQEVAVLESGEVPRESRKPGMVKVAPVGQQPVQADHIVDVNEMVDDDPAPYPPTIRKTAAGSQKVKEADKPKTRPVVAEVLPDDPMEIAKADPVAEWFDNHSLSDILGKIVERIEEEKERKKAAKQLRKLADKLDPPTKFTRPDLDEVSQYFRELNAEDPDSFFDFYESKGWMVGKVSMKDWRASARKWVRENQNNGKGNGNGNHKGAGNGRSRGLTAEDVFSAESLGRGR